MHLADAVKEIRLPAGAVIWATGYTIAYPAWPMLSSATPGLLGYSSRAQLEEQVSVAKAAQKALEQAAQTEGEAEARAQAWRPWRSYAVLALWKPSAPSKRISAMGPSPSV